MITPKKISSAGYREKAQEWLDAIAVNPNQNSPPYEKLMSDLNGAVSRRITIRHRLVYQVLEKQKMVKLLRMWTHCE